MDYEAEYIDEDKYTTVTVEEMDASREGLLRSQEHSSDEEQGEEKPTSEANSKPKPVEKTKKASDKPKKKKKKFRYESKAERQLTRKKERLSNSRKAKARRER